MLPESTGNQSNSAKIWPNPKITIHPKRRRNRPVNRKRMPTNGNITTNAKKLLQE
jgi:hypothetical protein